MPRTWDPSSFSPAGRTAAAGGGQSSLPGRLRGVARARLERAAGHRAAAPVRHRARVLGFADAQGDPVFDQGFGELFVVRIAGNIVAPSVVGSIEFAGLPVRYATRGRHGPHALRRRGGHCERDRDRPRPRVAEHPIHHRQDHAPHRGPRSAWRHPTASSARPYARTCGASADHLRHGSAILEQLVVAGRVVVVGAEYELETGAVHFFDGVPASRRSA